LNLFNVNKTVNNENGDRTTERTLNFSEEDEYGNFPYIRFMNPSYDAYVIRPWFNIEPDYSMYRDGWEIGDGVHIATGNYTKSFTDLSIETPGVQSDFVRTYNSTSKEEGSFGIGWDFNIDVSKMIIPADDWYQIVLPDGSNTTFKKVGDNYECQNARSTMIKSDSEYIITNSANSKYFFNSSGRLYKVEDALGNALLISDIIDNIRTVTDSTSRTYKIYYNGDSSHSRITKIEDTVSDREINYSYDSDYRLISVESVIGADETYSYDENSHLNKITNCYNQETLNIVYNPGGQVQTVTNATGLVEKYTYDGSKKQTGVEEYDNNKLIKTIKYEYDEKNAVTFNEVTTDNETYEVDKIEYSKTDGKNKYNEVSKNTDIMGNITEYERDNNGNITKTINPDGTFTLTRYNAENNPVLQVDENGNTTITVYDSNGILAVKQGASLTPLTNTAEMTASSFDLIDYLDENAGNFAITTFEYYPASEVSGIIGLIHRSTDPEGNITEYTYYTSGNSKGLTNTTTIKNSDGVIENTVSYEYNNQLQISKETTSVDLSVNPAVYSVKEYEYDKYNNITKIENFGTGETALVTLTDYDLLGRKTAEYTPKYADKSHGTTYTYNADDSVATQTDADGNVTSFEYDGYGNAIQKINPDGTVNVTEYDGLQREKSTYFQPSIGGFKQILTSTEYEFVKNQNFGVYENLQNVWNGATNSSGLKTTLTTYITSNKQVVTETLSDFRGNTVTEKTNGITKRTSNYYKNGQLARQTDALGNTTKYEYGYLNLLTKTYTPFNSKSDNSVNYSVSENIYDKNGNVTTSKQTVQEQNSNVTRYSITENQYNALGLVTQVKLSSNFETDVNIAKYFYNNAGVQTSMQTGLDSETDTTYLTTSYIYDQWFRKVTTTDSTGYNSGTTSYDQNGNIIETTDPNGNVTTNVYDVLGRLTSSNTVGNSTSQNVTKAYTYDNMGRVMSTTANSLTTYFVYDIMGRKVSENNDTFIGYDYEGVSQYVSNYYISINHVVIYNIVSYEYGGEMRVIGVNDSEDNSTEYIYIDYFARAK
jgi:YD repeat-containing protein